MEPTTWLLFLSVAMFLGAFLAGLVPLAFSLAPSRVRVLTVVGAGLLVGTALAVVIPEGVHVWYDVVSASEHHVHVDPAVVAATTSAAAAAAAAAAGGGGLTDVEQPAGAFIGDPLAGRNIGFGSSSLVVAGGGVDGAVGAGGGLDHDHAGGGSDAHAHDSHAGHSHGKDDWLIGFALVLGFVFMLLVDRMSGPGGGHGHSHGGPAAVVDAGSQAELGRAADADEAKPAVAPNSGKSTSATLGLLIHAGVDGVALGSAALSNSGSLSMIVFIAIMLHKAPAAFGLASYLLHQGMSAAAVRRYLVWFAGVAPVCSILTYSTLSVAGEMQPKSLALLLIFSGGTFLYVATCHILPDLSVPTPLRPKEVAALVVGILLPVVPAMLNLEHGH